MISSPSYRPILHWLAIATAATALLPIALGALVTTLDAGMAFRDWPSSDGHSMLAYPWLKSHGDKFLEHGHRLAGIVIGCAAISLAATTWFLDQRNWMRWCAAGALLAVILQGLLGGKRVLADERLYAMFHGALAAVVFAYLTSVAVFSSHSWFEPPLLSTGKRTGALKFLAAVTPVLIVVQYSLGGMIRHLGRALYEHLGMAFVVLAAVLATVVAAQLSRCAWLKRPAYALLAIAIIQLSLGGAAWLTKYGLPSVGYVAVQRSAVQILVRTSHTVVAMLLLATSVVLLLRVLRTEWTASRHEAPVERPAILLSPTRLTGGL